MSGEDRSWRRLDARILWVDALWSLLSLLPMAFQLLVLGVEPGQGTLWPAVAVAVFGTGGAVGDALRWAKTRYRITDELVEVRSGLLIRSARSLRRDRVRTVDTRAKLRHRLAGLRLVTIGTGQRSLPGESTLTLDAISREAAGRLRQELLGLSAPSEPEPTTPQRAEEPEPAATGQVFARLRWSWMVHNVFHWWAYVAGAGLLWGGYWLAGNLGLAPNRLIEAIVDRSGWFWLVVIGLAAAGVVGTVAMLVAFVTENWRFRLDRLPAERGSTLRTSQGLFKTREVNRDDHRLRGVELREPLLWRWLGTAELHVISTGLGSWGGTPASMVLPRVPARVARAVAAAVLPEATDLLAAPLRRHPRAALRRRLVRAMLLTVLAGAVLAWPAATGAAAGWTPVLALALLPAALAAAVVAYRALGHTTAGQYIVVRSGLASRATAALQRRAVVGVALRQSLLQRRLGLLTITAATAAGQAYYQAIDLATADGLALADQATSGLLAPFLNTEPDRVGA